MTSPMPIPPDMPQHIREAMVRASKGLNFIYLFTFFADVDIAPLVSWSQARRLSVRSCDPFSGRAKIVNGYYFEVLIQPGVWMLVV